MEFPAALIVIAFTVALVRFATQRHPEPDLIAEVSGPQLATPFESSVVNKPANAMPPAVNLYQEEMKLIQDRMLKRHLETFDSRLAGDPYLMTQEEFDAELLRALEGCKGTSSSDTLTNKSHSFRKVQADNERLRPDSGQEHAGHTTARKKLPESP